MVEHSSMPTSIQRFCAAAAIWLFVLWTQAVNCAPAGISVSSADDATLVEYEGEQVVAKVSSTRIFVDHEKVGFFRMGLVPVVVIQDAQIQIQSIASLTNVLAGLNSSDFSSSGARRLELRNLTLSRLGENVPRLRAASARVAASGALDLSDVSVPGADGHYVSMARATLQISGPAAGWLCWRADGTAAEIFLLKPSENSPP